MRKQSDPQTQQQPKGIVQPNTGDVTAADHPKGIVRPAGTRVFTANQMNLPGGGSVSAISTPARTFKVTTSHRVLKNNQGVEFKVEDVAPALPEDSKRSCLSDEQAVACIKAAAEQFYSSKSRGDVNDYDMFVSARRGRGSKPPAFRIEARSGTPINLVQCGGDGFMACCMTAFARHLPLELSPDHLWALVAFAFARHVNKHAEQLRHHFVDFDGKQRLEIRADGLVMGKSSAAEWEAGVFPAFSEQIKQAVGASVHADLSGGGFSTTTAAARACHEVTLMSTLRSYFSYGMRTRCGIPSVTLRGTRADWASLRSRAESLAGKMTPDFADKWVRPCLLPILDQFVAAYDGDVDHGFWQSMVKLRHTGGGSGSYSFVSGWVQNLFPYLAGDTPNQNLRPWQHAYFAGPQPDQFPPVSSSVPVDWDYHGTVHDLHFHAGFVGFCQSQDPAANGRIAPALGWAVTHDPLNKDPAARLADAEQEIVALGKGHAGSGGSVAPALARRLARLEQERAAAAAELQAAAAVAK
jgi:hypothetical protein